MTPFKCPCAAIVLDLMQNKRKLHMSSAVESYSAQQLDYIFYILQFITPGITYPHDVFCPFMSLPFPCQISQYRDRSSFLWGLYLVDSAGGLYNISSEEATYYLSVH